MLFAHRHSHETPSYHVEIMDAWRSADEFVLIEAYRAGAKTTLAEEFLLMEGAFANFFYALLIAETYSKACQTLEAIAFEAVSNSKLKTLFGGRLLSRKPTENKVWFASGALIEAVGWEQELRGFKYHARRPDRAYLDDIENKERVRDKDAVDASYSKLYRELRPAMDKENRKIRFTQTPIAVDCLVTRVRADPEWVCYAFPICDGVVEDPKTRSAWPARFPMEWVRAEKAAFERAGKLTEFDQEYMLIADSPEAKSFREEMLMFCDSAPAAWLPRQVIMDPSRTASATKSDRTGRVVVSRMGSRFFVHESGGYYWKPSEIVQDAFNTAERHHAAGLAIEKNSLDDWLMEPLRNEMLKRGRALELEALQAPQDRDKLAFIMGLFPFFKAKEVYFVGGRTAHAQLIAEILNFPAGMLDIFNALAYALRVFGGQLVYEDFGEDNVAAAPEPERTDTVYLAWNATSAETVCVAVMRHARYESVLRDWAVAGAVSDAVRAISVEVRSAFPHSRIETYVPAQLHDEVRRVGLYPALIAERFRPYRAEHAAVARGGLADRIRARIKGRSLLSVDRRAERTLAALAGGYKFVVKAGGKMEQEPKAGVSRLVGEALECLTVFLDKGINEAAVAGAHYNVNPQGQKYMSSLPTRRSP